MPCVTPTGASCSRTKCRKQSGQYVQQSSSECATGCQWRQPISIVPPQRDSLCSGRKEGRGGNSVRCLRRRHGRSVSVAVADHPRRKEKKSPACALFLWHGAGGWCLNACLLAFEHFSVVLGRTHWLRDDRGCDDALQAEEAQAGVVGHQATTGAGQKTTPASSGSEPKHPMLRNVPGVPHKREAGWFSPAIPACKRWVYGAV